MNKVAALITLLLVAAVGMDGIPVLPMSVLRVPHAWTVPYKAAEIGLTAYYRDIHLPGYVDPEMNKAIIPAAFIVVGLANWIELSAFGGDSVYFLHAKAALIKEKGNRPQIAVGMDNILSPVNRHRPQDYTPANAPDWSFCDHPDKVDYEYWSPYLSISKHFDIGENSIDLTLGLGANRFIGSASRDRVYNSLFWAVQPWIGKNIALAVEYSGADFNAGVIGYIKKFQIKLGVQAVEDLFKDNGYEMNKRIAVNITYLYDKYASVADIPKSKKPVIIPENVLKVTAVTSIETEQPLSDYANNEVQEVDSPQNLAIAPQQVYAKRKALVIGNRDYGSSSLKNPINDAAAVVSAIKEKGFEVYFKTDADLETMNLEANRFLRLINSTDEVLFYYSGHGAQVGGLNYLIPARADIVDEEQLQYRAFNANEFMDRLQKAHTSIIILDACRDNPFRGTRSGSKGLAVASGMGNQMIIFSTGPGKTAEDGPSGSNSPFTSELVRHILTSEKQILLMMQDVAKAVYDKTGGKQDPWLGSNLKTDFFFGRPALLESP